MPCFLLACLFLKQENEQRKIQEEKAEKRRKEKETMASQQKGLNIQ